jgi:hypothetical protein
MRLNRNFNQGQRTPSESGIEMGPLFSNRGQQSQDRPSAAPNAGTLSGQEALGRATGHQLQTTARASQPAILPRDPSANPDTAVLRSAGRTFNWVHRSTITAHVKLALEAGINAAVGWGLARNGLSCLLQRTLLKDKESTDFVYHAAQAATATVAVSAFMLIVPMLMRGMFAGAEIKPRKAEDAFPMPDFPTDEQRTEIEEKRTEFTRRQAEVNQSIGRMTDRHGALCFGVASGGITALSDKFPRSLIPATAVSGLGAFMHVLGQNVYKNSAKYEGQHLFEAKNNYTLCTYRANPATGNHEALCYFVDDFLLAARAQFGVPNATSHPGSHLIGNIAAEACGQFMRHAITFGTLGMMDYSIAKASEVLLESYGADQTKLDLTLGRPSTGVKELDAVISAVVMAATLSSTSYFSGGAYLAGRKGTLAVGTAPAQPPARAYHKSDPVRSAAISGIPPEPGARRMLVTGNHRPADTSRNLVTHGANFLTNPAVMTMELVSDATNTLLRRNRPSPQRMDDGEAVHFVAADFLRSAVPRDDRPGEETDFLISQIELSPDDSTSSRRSGSSSGLPDID